MERAGLEIVEIALQPLVAGSLVLSKDEKELGVALVDIGGGSTTVAVFEGGHLVFSTVIPIGGENITKDLSIVLRTTMEDAEKIKLKYGHAFYDDASEDEIFDVPIIGSDQKQPCNQLMIAEIIEARLIEIFEMVLEQLRRNHFRDLPGGFVLTGGVVKMPGVLDLAQQIFQSRVRTAEPNYIGVREPQYTTAVGLIKHSCQKSRQLGVSLGNSAVVSVAEKTEKVSNYEPNTVPAVKEKPAKNPNEPGKFKKLLGYFFE